MSIFIAGLKQSAIYLVFELFFGVINLSFHACTKYLGKRNL